MDLLIIAAIVIGFIIVYYGGKFAFKMRHRQGKEPEPEYILEDKHFGNIKWDKNKPWSGIITLANGKTAYVEFDIEETEEEAARNILKFLIEGETRIRHKVAVSLFRDCRDWIPDYITTPEELALRIELSSISFGEGGGQLYYYANGDDYIFTDHVICVWFDANGEIEDKVDL
jgi:hypothetical protein